MKQILKALVLSIFTMALLIVLSTQFGKIPPVGKFFDPAIGFWQAAGQDDAPPVANFALPDLKSKVTILFENRGIPHIFGDDELDVYAAIGYLHARDRLWQMDMQYRYAAGKLSEALGRQTLTTDISQRQLGLLITSQRIVADLDSNRIEYRILKAYARGVNHFVRQLSYRQFPYEFKLLNYPPELWTIEKTILINLMMMQDLSFTMEDLHFSRLQTIFSSHDLNELFPVFSPISYPIIPDQNGSSSPKRLKRDNNSDPLFHSNLKKDDFAADEMMPEIDGEGLGSNNWVVSGSKTTTGKPILANDPHLGLELPSIWYEAHLNCPAMNVYGVTIPGAPFIIIGFNESIAWGLTNSGWDVVDLYREKFDNEQHDHYWFNDAWRTVEKIPQIIHIKDAPDTTIILEYTHRGPIITRNNEYFSLQWTGHAVRFDGVAVYWLNKAQNYDDYRHALECYNCPAQNFVYADVDGNIAITCAGKNPIRRSGFAGTIADGRDDQSEWISATPFQQLPASKNPRQGYLASANQQPINQSEPYFGWNWPADHRARRINELLKDQNSIDVKTMMQFQTDAYSVNARDFVPYIIAAFNTNPAPIESQRLDSMLFYLKNWQYEMRKPEIGATIFERFISNFQKNTWRDHYPAADDQRFLSPDMAVLKQITMHSPDSKWFDDVTTPAKETRDDIIRKSLAETEQQLAEELGPIVSHWKLERYHKTKIPHLSRLKPLGIDPFPNNGGNGTLNVGPGKINTHGPSWRMIVSLEKPIRAWGVYPGGQSGNPASKHYVDFLDRWKNEDYFELLFPKIVTDMTDNLIESKLTILPEDKK